MAGNVLAVGDLEDGNSWFTLVVAKSQRQSSNREKCWQV
jgi:hypothetical protein